jgi:hypothetical protein
MKAGPEHVMRASQLIVAPSVWAGHFLIVYGSHALLCTRGSSEAHFVLVAATSGLAVTVLAALMMRVRSARVTNEADAFIARAGVVLALLSLFAVLWATLPALMLRSCA